MNDPLSSPEPSVPRAVVQQIDQVCDRFEGAWKGGQAPRIEDYLGLDPAIDRSGFRRRLLVELVMIDLEHRWRSAAEGASGSAKPRLAEYVARYPELGVLEDLSDALIAKEYQARQLWGNRPGRDEYLAQFGGKHPNLSDVLAQMDEELASSGKDRAMSTPGGSQETDAIGAKNGAQPTSKGKAPSAPSEYGNYRVVKSLAKGGMGQLSIAQDRSLNRTVVLKEILESLAKNPKSRRRFIHEAQITGQLEHPGIVPVYALGVDRHGRPFYTMRRVRGHTLEKAIANYHAKPSSAGLRELLRRFIAVCQTLAYAHARGVVHRDLKPSNVMAGDFGETLVLDWGLAKPIAQGEWLQSTRGDVAHEESAPRPMVTEPGAKVGTAAYMAPEQAEGSAEESAPAADVYGLGSILYQLLVGKPPYTGKSSDEILEKVKSTAPEKPSDVRRDAPLPLEAICLKAMARRPEARYPDAAALGADVQHWLDDEPVEAYPEPWLGRAWRWARHHKTATASGLVFLFTAMLAVAVAGPLVVGQRAQARAAEQTAEAYKRQADAAAALADQKDKEAEQADKGRDEAQAQSVKHLEAAMAANGEVQAARAREEQLKADLEAKQEQAAEAEKLKRELDDTRTQLVAVEGRVAEETERARIARDKADEFQEESAKLKQEAQRLRELSGELSQLASGEPPKLEAVEPEPSLLADFTEGDVDGFDVIASDAAFSLLTRDWSRRQAGDSSLRIDTLSQGQVRVGYPSSRSADWDLSAQEYVHLALFAGSRTSGQLESLWVRMGRGSSYVEYQSDPRIVDRARDRWFHTSVPLAGDRLWARTDTNEPDLSHVDWIEVHAGTTGTGLTFSLDDLGFARKPVAPWIRGAIPAPAKAPGVLQWQVETAAPHAQVQSVAWSPDGKLIACGTMSGRVRIYDASTLRLVRLLVGHTNTVHSVAWSPDGQWLASASQDATLRLWQADGTPGPVMQCQRLFWCVAWNPDGQRLASGDHHGEVRLWEADGTPGPVLKSPAGNVWSVAWSPDGRQVAAGGTDGTVRLWEADGTPGPVLEGHTGAVHSVAWSPDGQRLASGSADTTVRLWAPDGTPGAVLEGHTSGVTCVAWSPDGRSLLSTENATVRLWEGDGTPGPVFEKWSSYISSAAWRPDGRRLVLGSAHGMYLGDADGGNRSQLDRQYANVWSVAWSPDGKKLASGSWDGRIRLWRPDGTLDAIFDRWSGYISSVDWSPDGQRLATGHSNRAVRLWDADGTPGPGLGGHTEHVLCVAWSPDGRNLASASLDKTARLWQADGSPGPVLEGHTASVNSVAWSPDSKMLASASHDKTVRLWQADGTPGPVLEGHGVAVSSVAWSPDGRWLTSAGGNTVRFWEPDGTPGLTLQGHGPLAWSPDGRWLASGYQDVFRLWHADGTPGPVLQGSAYAAVSLAWSPDGRRLTLGSQANTILQWDIGKGEPEWVALLLNDEKSVTFSPAGEILHGDREVIEKELVYLVQREPGEAMELLKPSEFRKLTAAAIEPTKKTP